MKQALLILLFFCFAGVQLGYAQPNNAPIKLKQLTIEEYVLRYSGIAKEEMRRTGIPASIKLAQGILESNFGNSPLATEANNHFGIKCHTGYQGKGFYMTDDAENECFRIYDRPEDSYFDHSEFLRLRPRYADLFKIDPKDYKSWARGLQNAGYATNPQYANLIIRLIEERNLHQFDTADPELSKNLKTEEDVIKTFENKLVIFNDIKTVIAQPKQTFNDIAKKFEVSYKNLKKFNEFQDDDTNYFLIPGSKVFLEPKKTKGMGIKHKVLENETMYSISQKEGIRLDKLYEYNLMKRGEEPAVGEDLFLRNKAPKMPKLKSQKEADKLYEKLKKITAKNRDIPKEVKKDVDTASINIQDTTAKTFDNNNNIAPNNTLINNNTIDAVSSNQEVPIFHIVEPKQTLYTISLMYNIKSQKLIDMNNLSSNALEIGQKLIIGYVSDKVKTAEDLKVKKTEKEPILHTVKPRETIYSIAEWYKVKPDDIKRWNNLPDFNVNDSMQLIVGYLLPPKAEPVVNKSTVEEKKIEKNITTEVAPVKDTATVKTTNTTEIFPQYYIVENEKESIDSIAIKFNTPIGLLQKMNNTTARQFEKGKKVIVGYEKLSTKNIVTESKNDTPLTIKNTNNNGAEKPIINNNSIEIKDTNAVVIKDTVSNNDSRTVKIDEPKIKVDTLAENKPGQNTLVESNLKLQINQADNVLPVKNNETINAIYHTVVKGETLYAISRKYNVPVETIIKLNKMSSTGIEEGQKLIINNKGEAVVNNQKEVSQITQPVIEAVKPTNTATTNIIKAPDNLDQFHMVQKGETLYGISRLYNVSVENLIKLNKMVSTDIKEGQKIIVRVEAKNNQSQTNNDKTLSTQPVKVDAAKLEEQNKPRPLPNNATANDDIVNPVTIDGIKYHTVQAGETLYRLSILYKVSVEQLQEWNKMKDFTVKTGMQYIVGK